MSANRDDLFERWWPAFQSLVLVKAPVEAVARILKDVTREGERKSRPFHFRLESEGWRAFLPSCRAEWIRANSLEELLEAVRFTRFSTMKYAFPTRSNWTVLWNNSGEGGGAGIAPSLLAKRYGLESIEFESSDRNAIQLAGTWFTYRKPAAVPGEVAERSVYCCSQGSRWVFHESGTPLPQEDLTRYSARRKRDRLNEDGMAQLLQRLGASPWRESFYDFPNSRCFRLTDLVNLRACPEVPFSTIRERALQPEPLTGDEHESLCESELRQPPDYLAGWCSPEMTSLAARKLLSSTKWRQGHTEFKVFPLQGSTSGQFQVELPVFSVDVPPVVRLTCTSSGTGFAAYDSRRHRHSPFFASAKPVRWQSPLRCRQCPCNEFHVAVGFTIHEESTCANDATWVAIAVECLSCHRVAVAFRDEVK